MKKMVISLVTCALLFCAQLGFSAINPMEGIKIAGVQSMQIHKNSKNIYYMQVLALLKNSSGNAIKFKQNDYIFSLGKLDVNGQRHMRKIGKAKPTEKIFINKSETDPAEVWELIVRLGSDETKVLEQVSYIMNIIGNPANKVQIGIGGETKAWRQVDNGWVSPGLLEVDLEYTPKLEKQVLFE